MIYRDIASNKYFDTRTKKWYWQTTLNNFGLLISAPNMKIDSAHSGSKKEVNHD